MSLPTGVAIPFNFSYSGFPEADTGADLINDSITTILLTYLGDRVHRPTFGSILMNYVFENINLATIFKITSEIRRAVTAWESRVIISNINIANNVVGQLNIDIFWVANGGLTGVTNLNINTANGSF